MHLCPAPVLLPVPVRSWGRRRHPVLFGPLDFDHKIRYGLGRAVLPLDTVTLGARARHSLGFQAWLVVFFKRGGAEGTRVAWQLL